MGDFSLTSIYMNHSCWNFRLYLLSIIKSSIKRKKVWETFLQKKMIKGEGLITPRNMIRISKVKNMDKISTIMMHAHLKRETKGFFSVAFITFKHKKIESATC